MTPHELQASTSFLLGRVHGGIRAILESEKSESCKLRAIEDLEAELFNGIQKLYYPNPIESSPT